MGLMNVTNFINKLEDIAKNYKTLYVMGCYGAPLNENNKKYYCNNNSYNKSKARQKMILSADKDTFGFDCSCLIKSILWGWSGNKEDSRGGVKYGSNNVPDVNADQLIERCKNVSSNFKIISVGEALWVPGHIGVYIGNGLAVECSPIWKNGVQITAVANMGNKSGYNARKWAKHGYLPYLNYNNKEKINIEKNNNSKVEYASHIDKALVGTYVVKTNLHIRCGAGINKKSISILQKNSKVFNYGYYSLDTDNNKWLYVTTENGVKGFCSYKYLNKC